MFDYNNVHSAFDPQGVEDDSLVPTFDQEKDSASERFIWQLTGVAVNKIANPSVRRRARYLVAPKVASRVSTDDRSRNAHEAWMRFAAVQLDTSHLVKLGTGNVRGVHATNSPFSVINLGTGVVEQVADCLLYTSPSPRDQRGSRMPSSA